MICRPSLSFPPRLAFTNAGGRRDGGPGGKADWAHSCARVRGGAWPCRRRGRVAHASPSWERGPERDDRGGTDRGEKGRGSAGGGSRSRPRVAPVALHRRTRAFSGAYGGSCANSRVSSGVGCAGRYSLESILVEGYTSRLWRGRSSTPTSSEDGGMRSRRMSRRASTSSCACSRRAGLRSHTPTALGSREVATRTCASFVRNMPVGPTGCSTPSGS